MLMQLALALAKEAGVELPQVMLLRHFKGKVDAIRRANATLDEFTLTQPTGTPYDFLAHDRAPIEVVGVIVDDRVFAVYRILGVDNEGSNRSITSASFRALDGAMRYPERQVRRFAAEKLPSALIGLPIVGWSNPRSAVARCGGKLFASVKVESA
jgi:hypothetical protein